MKKNSTPILHQEEYDFDKEGTEYETLIVPFEKTGLCSLCVLFFCVDYRYDVFKEVKKYESNKNWRIPERTS